MVLTDANPFTDVCFFFFSGPGYAEGVKSRAGMVTAGANVTQAAALWTSA